MLSTCFKTWNVNSIGVSGIPGAEKPERSMGDVNDFSRTRRVSHLSLLAFGLHAHGHIYERSLLPLLLRHIIYLVRWKHAWFRNRDRTNRISREGFLEESSELNESEPSHRRCKLFAPPQKEESQAGAVAKHVLPCKETGREINGHALGVPDLWRPAGSVFCKVNS